MSDLISDILEGRIGYREANAVCNAGGKMLKVIEMTAKYGRTAEDAAIPARELELAAPANRVTA